MQIIENEKRLIMDGSKLIIESLVRSGADAFMGYPITPANLLYSYSHDRFPAFFAAPDEITTLQWMSGFSVAGKLPVTATSFPGFALMLESVNMAYMMELPMVIVLAQRLGPATGSATCGAQGDLSLLNGCISGGFTLPVISLSSMNDCWELANKAVKMAIELRTPVVLLTSKEEIMTQVSFDISQLSEISPVSRKQYSGAGEYIPYQTDESLVPDFLPVSNNNHQVRFTASTHDKKGIIQNTAREAIDNTKRLQQKLQKNLENHLYYEYDFEEGAETLLISYGITASASREAVKILRGRGEKISLFLPKTLLPVSPSYFEIINKYKRVVIAEENFSGQYKKILFGEAGNEKVSAVNGFAAMITPAKIIEEILIK